MGLLDDNLSLQLHDREQLSRKLRVSLVDSCNLSCAFCHNEGQGPLRRGAGAALTVEQYSRIVAAAAAEGVSEVKLTGGEPLLYRDRRGSIVDLVAALAAIRSDRHVGISMTTNGLLLPRFARELKSVGLDRVNVSLHTLDAGTFARVVSGGRALSPQAVLSAVRVAVEAGLTPVKVNTVLFRHRSGGENVSEIDRLVRACRDAGVAQLRFYTLLAHDDFPDHAEWYQFWDPEVLGALGAALYGPGAAAARYARAAGQFVDEWKGRMYPKPTFVARAGSFEVAIEAMESARFADLGVPDEGPYSLRLSSDGKLRGVNDRYARSIDLLPALARGRDEELRQAFREGRRALLP